MMVIVSAVLLVDSLDISCPRQAVLRRPLQSARTICCWSWRIAFRHVQASAQSHSLSSFTLENCLSLLLLRAQSAVVVDPLRSPVTTSPAVSLPLGGLLN